VSCTEGLLLLWRCPPPLPAPWYLIPYTLLTVFSHVLLSAVFLCCCCSSAQLQQLPSLLNLLGDTDPTALAVSGPIFFDTRLNTAL
jgi:hypothetical protein